MHFTDMDNLPGIVARGALLADSMIRAVGGPAFECADTSIKHRRRTIPIRVSPFGLVGDYVPFYYAPRSPMLYRIWKGGVPGYQRGQASLVYLVSSVETVLSNGLTWVGSDGNCAAAMTDHYNDWNELTRAIDWPLMTERIWRNTDEDGDRL
ncbi:DUF4433 domain-containing protein, partial [Actinophytocola sp.]|uniref:type II toxin-antitoxin system toxin DNA ADP-ribosyl transferase DarT n=1 Tax=Actinophytocola sp. TaxID=1872138 RepID=UPI00389B0F9B